MTPKRILVLGGTGFVGHHLCQQLACMGWRTTVVTRQLPARSVQMLLGVDVVQADVFDTNSLTELMRHHDAVVNLIAILHGNEAAFERMHVQLPQRIAQAALQAGVHRLIHISALGADVNAPSRYQRSKARGELALQAAQGLDLTLIRPSVIFGADDAFINVFAQLQRIFPVVPLAGAHTRFAPVYVKDVVQAIVKCLQNTRTIGRTFEAYGPDVMTLKQLVQLAGAFVGCARPVIPLPYALGYVQACLMEWAPGKTLMSRDNLASMQQDNISSGHANHLGTLGLTSLVRLPEIFPPKRPRSQVSA